MYKRAKLLNYMIAGVAELVDATDLKSDSPLFPAFSVPPITYHQTTKIKVSHGYSTEWTEPTKSHQLSELSEQNRNKFKNPIT